MVNKAKEYACLMHKGQVRKGKETPFTNHLDEAFEIAQSLTNDEVILAATYLHDVVEDTPATIEDIRELFGDEVAYYVNLETEDKREHLSSRDTWRIRKEEQLKNLNNHKTKELTIIVLADKLANTNEMVNDYKMVGDELWKRFNNNNVDELGWYYQSMAKIIGEFHSESDAYNQLIMNINFLFNL